MANAKKTTDGYLTRPKQTTQTVVESVEGESGIERSSEDVPVIVEHTEMLSYSGSGLFKSIMYPVFAVVGISLAFLAYHLMDVKGSVTHAILRARSKSRFRALMQKKLLNHRPKA